MARRTTIPIIGGTAKDRSIQVNNQQTVNLITAPKGTGAKAPVILETAPGLIDLGASGDGAIRSSKMVNWMGDLYGVFGTEFVQFSTTTGVTVIGTLNANTGRVVIAGGRSYIALVDGTDGYTYDGTTFAQIADVDFPGNLTPVAGLPTHIAYQDGFFIVNDAGSDNFYISAVEDPTSWNALDFEAASVAPDAALGVASAFSILYLPGEETVQLYYNTGNVDFPYEIILNATQEVGIVAPYSLADSDAGVFFLATTPEGGLFAYRIIGQQGQRISIDEQDTIFGEASAPEDAFGFIYQQEGKAFYVLQLDAGLSSERTMLYNIKASAQMQTPIWEERIAQDGSAWRVGGHGILNRQNYVGSRLAARYGRLDLSTFTDAGEELIRRRVTQVQHVHGELLDWHELQIDIQGGVGNVTAPGDDPVLRMRYSDDGGASWSDQLTASLGKIGERTTKARYHNLGISQGRGRIFELEASDPVPLTIIAAQAVATVLND